MLTPPSSFSFPASVNATCIWISMHQGWLWLLKPVLPTWAAVSAVVAPAPGAMRVRGYQELGRHTLLPLRLVLPGSWHPVGSRCLLWGLLGDASLSTSFFLLFSFALKLRTRPWACVSRSASGQTQHTTSFTFLKSYHAEEQAVMQACPSEAVLCKHHMLFSRMAAK